ncbi:MAG: NADAR family protein [Cetobacterium sp.]
MSINSFRDEYAFLSNFYRQKFIYKNIEFDTAEHAFQWAKAIDESGRNIILNCSTPSQARYHGKRIKINKEWWECEKFRIMEEILVEKFKNANMQKLLLETGNDELIEGNRWHDNIWGACQCYSCSKKSHQNNLGKILMNIRSSLVVLKPW